MKNSKDISECITELEFENYIKNNLSNSEKNRIEQHCSFCEMCNDSFEGLLLLEQANLFEKQKKKLVLEQGGKRVNMWFYFSAAAAIFIVLGISFLFLNKTEKTQISSNELNFNEPVIQSKELEINSKTKNQITENPDQNLEKVELKKIEENLLQPENGMVKNIIATDLAMAKAKLPVSKTKYALEQDEALEISTKVGESSTSKIASEDLTSIKYTSKNENIVDDVDKKTEEDKRTKDLVSTENTSITSTNNLSNTIVSGSSPANTFYSAPANSPTLQLDNAASKNLYEVTVESKATKRTALDSKINSREGEELKIKAAKKFILQKNYSKAIGQLEKIIETNSNSEYYKEALWLKAICLKNSNNLTESKKILNDIIKKNSSYSKSAKDSLKVWSK